MSKPVNRMKTRVDSIRALAAAIVVYRANGNRVEKFSDTNKGNKEQTLELLDGVSALEITEQDLANASELRNYLNQKITIAELTGTRISDFFRDVAQLTNTDQVAYFSIGQLVWAPKLADDARKQEEIKEDINQYYFTSKYIGQEKDRVELTFTSIEVRYLSVYNCYRHVGHDNQGNLITFLNKDNISGTVRIKARVKGCDTNHYYNNAKTTNLNFVKVVK
jgi:hypothetical protein